MPDENMSLHYTKLGMGHPLIILHGLYGSGGNWLSIAKALSGFCKVYLLDQRNHGQSPHYDQHDYPLMVQDLADFFQEQQLSKAMILGHSMGGKVAMWFATSYPGMVSKLIVADVSPASYHHHSESHVNRNMHQMILSSMMDVDLTMVQSLGDAEKALQQHIEDQRLRHFLLKNLRKDQEGVFSWNLNLPVLLKNLDALTDGLDFNAIGEQQFRQFPSLFIRGERSGYITDEDAVLIRKIFPLSQLVTIKEAGHWLHAEQPSLFTQTVKQFLTS